MSLNTVGMNSISYNLEDPKSKTIHPSTKKKIEDKSWVLRSEQIQYIIRKIYSLAVNCFQKIKGLGVKVGQQFRFAVVYIDRAIVFKIHIGGVIHHHHYPESRREVQSLQSVEIKKDELQKYEQEQPKESIMVEPKKLDLLYKTEVKPYLPKYEILKNILK